MIALVEAADDTPRLWCGHSATPTRDGKGEPVEGGNVAKVLDGRDEYGRPGIVEICLACTAEAAAAIAAAAP